MSFFSSFNFDTRLSTTKWSIDDLQCLNKRRIEWAEWKKPKLFKSKCEHENVVNSQQCDGRIFCRVHCEWHRQRQNVIHTTIATANKWWLVCVCVCHWQFILLCIYFDSNAHTNTRSVPLFCSIFFSIDSSVVHFYFPLAHSNIYRPQWDTISFCSWPSVDNNTNCLLYGSW